MKNFRVEPFKKWQIWLGEVLSRVNVFVLAMSKYKRYRHLPFLGVTVDRRRRIIEAVERHSETEPKYPQEHKLREKFAFSLIELMISLIAISLITAAFAPVISKKLSSSEFTIGVGSDGSSANMADWVTDCSHVNANCMYCLPDGNCQMCDLNCGNKYKNVEECICEDCSSKFDNCSECNRAECTKCETGYYALNGKCNKTHAGSYSPDGITEKECPEGYFCEEGKTPQTCSSGTYSEKGAKSQSDCSSCPQGYSCNNGIKSECSAGYYSKSGASVCTNCDSYNSTNSAYYNTTSKSNSCTLCEAGYMCVNGQKTSCDNPTYAAEGSTYCSTCTNCTQCDNKTGSCFECEEGYYLVNNECKPCPAGYYCSGSSSEPQSCPAGCSSCISSINCTSCKSNHQYSINNGLGICTQCSEGYYCPGGIEEAQGCVNSCKSCSNTSTCNTCNNGYYINSSSTCTQCEKGYYCPDGQTRTSCDAGKYQNEKGQTSCKTCPSATGTANTTCGCNAGYYLKSNVCTPCGAGYYQPNNEYTGTSCTSCGGGTAECNSATGVASSCNEHYCIKNNKCVAMTYRCTGTITYYPCMTCARTDGGTGSFIHYFTGSGCTWGPWTNARSFSDGDQALAACNAHCNVANTCPAEGSSSCQLWTKCSTNQYAYFCD